MWKTLKSIFCRTAPVAPAATSLTDTEFTAEVVRVTRLSVHPNADRLEIARFEMRGLGETAYEVVVRKGSAKVDDLMCYFSVDCLLPTDHPDFKFLATPGSWKTHHRLRAARLRGVFSQGLLIPAGDFLAYGDNVAALFRVTYHQPVEKGPEFTGSKCKTSGPQPCPKYAIDSLKKMPRLFYEGEPVCVTEKIHGCNFRFGWVRRKLLGVPLGWRFVVGSHNMMRSGGDMWSAAAESMDLANKTRRCKGMVFYGELYGYTKDGGKIQDLTYGAAPHEGPHLAIFDVRHLGDDEWLGVWDRFDLCMEVGLDHVPVLHACAVWRDDLVGWAEGTSDLDSKTQREGIVVESLTGPRRKAKFVGQGYLTRKGA